METLSITHDTIGGAFVKAELRGFVTCPNERLYEVPENGAFIRCEDFTPYYESLEEHGVRRIDLELSSDGKK